MMNLLKGSEREGLIEEMKPQFQALKKASTGRQIAAIDRLISAASSPTKADGSRAADPESPLHVDLSSAAPTPNLTMEPNSPSSSSPPSTSPSAAEDAPIDEGMKGKSSTAAQVVDPAASVTEA
jgi:mRNA-binding protein PUF3